MKLVYRKIISSLHYISWGGEEYHFLGSIKRLNQYFHKRVRIKPAPIVFTLLFLFLQKLYNSINIRNNKPEDKLIIIIMLRLIRTLKYSRGSFACTIHGYTMFYKFFTEAIDAPLLCFQDGFLPNNYTSKYLKYYSGVIEFLVWDSFSNEIFINNNLISRRSYLFGTCSLPKLPLRPIVVRNILVLTSGAGDWTAIKNRSDDDKLFELFINVARAFPEIIITYRPHPLWVHPMHQGVESISRICKYIKSINIVNMIVSQGSIAESNTYKLDHSTSIKSQSIDDEIQSADIIFGEHTQSLINSARKGKIFGSVNATGRRSLFNIYDKLGFPHFNSHEQIIKFINEIGSSTAPIKRYNQSVMKHNNIC